jgi:tetratricopeptide (TPR) repeat protein
MALIFLARVAQARGRHGEARENVQGALSLARTNSDEPFANEIRILLAEIDLSIGQFDRAEAQLQSVWKVYHAMGWPEGEANVLVHLAMSANLCGNATQAVAWLDQANTVDPENEEIDFQLVVDTLRGDVFTALVRTAEAEVAYARCLDACRSLQRPLGVVEIQAKMARLALTSGDLGRATKGIEGFIGGLNTSQDFNTLGESALDILLVCYQVLAAAADERAKGILNSAHESLHARASLLDPIERENYLTKVLTNRAIIAAWREQQISNRA